MSEPIRILNLFTIMNRGGAESMVMNYYRKIDRSKVQFDFVVHRQERGAYDDEIEALGGRIYRMCPITLNTLVRYKRMLHNFFEQHTEYKILHAHMSELGYFAFEKAYYFRIPIRICHAHNTPVFFSETFVEKIKRIPRELLAIKMRKFSTDFFTCSQEAGEWLYGKKNVYKMVFMRNAVDASLLKYDISKAIIVKKNMGWDGKNVIGHVGRFNPQKNHSLLIDIFENYYKKDHKSILVLVGSGFLEEEIKQRARAKGLLEQIVFLGTRSDMTDLYQAFDLFLFPSLYEGLPVSLIEAQAAGIPCVLSDRISSQTQVTEFYYPVSLKAPLDVWSETISFALEKGKWDSFNQIKKSGFDIASNALWLCDYYLKKQNTL